MSNTIKHSINKFIHLLPKIVRGVKKRIRYVYLRSQFGIEKTAINSIVLPVSINPKKTETQWDIRIFGVQVPPDKINWHCDYQSGYIYPMIKSEKIKYARLFNQGVDVIFPWELSRCYFVIRLSANYGKTSDEKYYHKFRKTILDWIEQNPFLYGVNWLCGMDAAIRASNWIIACNLFGDIFFQDKVFYDAISRSLSQHYRYIDKLIGYSETNNHLISMYCGLLLLSLSFPETKKSKASLVKSIAGLEYCMSTQVNPDGTDFEHSIPYHQLVLELFGSTTMIATNNNIRFSSPFYRRLFKMFEFTSHYIDSKGNAPQIGDNDSGHFIMWNTCADQDHRYLLLLGEAIFDYTFPYEKDTTELDIHFSSPTKITLSQASITPQLPSPASAFEPGGYYILKNELFHLLVFVSEKAGGHRHFDIGSFTLSYKGTPIVVDPGSFVYTSDLRTRCIFRDYYSHNLYIEKGYQNPVDSYFGIKIDRTCRVISFSESELVIETELSKDTRVRRQFLLASDVLHINDTIESNKEVVSYIHFSDCGITEKTTGNYMLRPDLQLSLSSEQAIWGRYDYSPSYGVSIPCPQLCVPVNNKLSISFTSIDLDQ